MKRVHTAPVVVDAYAQCLTCGTWHYCRYKRACTSKKGHTWPMPVPSNSEPSGEKR